MEVILFILFVLGSSFAYQLLGSFGVILFIGFIGYSLYSEYNSKK